jgi:hypothetical protein
MKSLKLRRKRKYYWWKGYEKEKKVFDNYGEVILNNGLVNEN